MEDILVVNCLILVEGSELETEWASRLARVVVDQQLESADRFTLLFGEGGLELYDAEVFKPGTRLEVKITPSPEGEDKPLIKGEVTAAAPELVAGEPECLLVEGYDGWYRLSREKKRRSFLDMSAGEIVRQMASDLGLKANVDSGDKLEYTLQDNISDLEFLVSLARTHRYELGIDTEQISFKKPQESGGAAVTLTWGQDLLQFTPKESAARQPSKVVVRGWDPVGKKAVVGTAGTGEEDATVGSGKVAGDLVTTGFGEAPSVVVERPVRTESEATALAKRIHSELSMGFVQVEGTAAGCPAIRPSVQVEIKNVGERYEGKYYVVRTKHVFSGRGYVTKFWARRNALNKNEPPAVTATSAREEEKDHWIEIAFVDNEETAMAIGDYVLKAPDGTEFTGTVGSDGKLRHDGIASGECTVLVKAPQELRWEKNPVMEGEAAKLTGVVPGAAGGNVTVDFFQHLREKDDLKLDSLTAAVGEGDAFEVEWTPSGLDELDGWTEFIARAKMDDRWAKSPVLDLHRRAFRDLRWSVAAARAGEKVELAAAARGFVDGTEATFTIWQYDAGGSDKKITDLEPVGVKGETARATWTYEYSEAEAEGGEKPYRPVEYYFEVKAKVEGTEYAAKSDLLPYRDWIEIDLVDPDGLPYAGEAYVLHLADGSTRKGTLDERGHAEERHVPPGAVRIEFPGLVETEEAE